MRLRTHPLASKWTTLIAGLCFAVAGLMGVVTSIPQFDKFAINVVHFDARGWVRCLMSRSCFKKRLSAIRVGN